MQKLNTSRTEGYPLKHMERDKTSLKKWRQDVWLCIENMLLAVVADRLGSGIVSYWGKYKGEVEKILGIPEGYQLATVIKIGVPGEEGFPRDKNPYAPRRAEFSWLHKNRF